MAQGLCIALLGGLAVACEGGSRWNGIEFYTVEKAEQLTETPRGAVEDSVDAPFAPLREKRNREMDVKVNMQFMKGNEENKRACELMNGHLVELLLKQSSELTIDEAIAQYVEEVKEEFHSDKVAYTYYDHLTGCAEYGKEGIINYRSEEEVFTGGAHPSTIMTILRFNALTGEFVTLDQVFPVPNQARLQEVLLNKLMQYNGVTSMEELNKKGYLEMTDMFVSPNFALRADSIEFYYNEYDIAPYAYGSTSICVGYDEVKDLMGVAFER